MSSLFDLAQSLLGYDSQSSTSALAQVHNLPVSGFALNQLPLDILAIVTSFLDSQWIVALWACGNYAFNHSLASKYVVEQLCVWMIRNSDQLAPLLHRFPHLTEIRVFKPTSLRSYVLTRESIPPNIENLLIESSSQPIVCSDWNALTQSRSPYFTHLRMFTIDCSDTIAANAVFPHLGPNLQFLKIVAHLRMTPSCMSLLPQSLEHLYLEDIDVQPYEETAFGEENVAFPSNLTHLTLITSWSWSCLSYPPNLLYLKLPSSRARRRIEMNEINARKAKIQLFPPTLQTFEYYGKLFDEFAAVLPRSLTSLIGAYESFVNRRLSFAEMPQSLTRWVPSEFVILCPSNLPPLLQNLSLADIQNLDQLEYPQHLTHLQLGLTTELTKTNIEKIPRTVTKLDLQAVFDPSVSTRELFAALPPRLTWLELHGAQEFDDSSALPTSLEYLLITDAIPANFFQGLHNLKYLKWLRFTTSDPIDLKLLPPSLTTARIAGPCLLDSNAIRSLPRNLLTLIILSSKKSALAAQDFAFLPPFIRYVHVSEIILTTPTVDLSPFLPRSLRHFEARIGKGDFIAKSKGVDYYSSDLANQTWEEFSSSYL